MKLVINIPDKIYNTFQRGNWSVTYSGKKIRDIVMNGIPLPEGHGDLIDRSTLEPDTEWSDWDDGWISYSYGQIVDADVVIKADGGGEE